MLTSAAGSAVKLVLPTTLPEVALIVVRPLELTTVAIPAVLMVATVGSEEVQVTELVILAVEPSE